MATFPLEPSYARAVIASQEQSCTSEVLDVISILSSSSTIFYDPSDRRDETLEARRKFRHPSGDHLMLLNVLKAYQDIQKQESHKACSEWCRKHFLNERTLKEALQIRDQLRDSCRRLNIDYDSSAGQELDRILRSLLIGSPQHSAMLHPDFTYRQTLGSGVSLYYLITYVVSK